MARHASNHGYLSWKNAIRTDFGNGPNCCKAAIELFFVP